MSKTMEYKIVEAASKYKLTDKVNGFMLQGWRPYGIPFFVDGDYQSGEGTELSTWNQTMTRLTVKDEEELEDAVILFNADETFRR